MDFEALIWRDLYHSWLIKIGFNSFWFLAYLFGRMLHVELYFASSKFLVELSILRKGLNFEFPFRSQ